MLVPALSAGRHHDASAEARRGCNLNCVGRRASAQRPVSAATSSWASSRLRLARARRARGLADRQQRRQHLPDARSAFQVAARSRLNCSRTSSCSHRHDESRSQRRRPANHVVRRIRRRCTSVREGIDGAARCSAKGPPRAVKVPELRRTSRSTRRAMLRGPAKIHLGQIVWTPFGPTARRAARSCARTRRPARHIDPFAPVSLQVSAGPRRIRLPGATSARVGARPDAATTAAQRRMRGPRRNRYVERLQRIRARRPTARLQPDRHRHSRTETYINNELLETTIAGQRSARTGTGRAARRRPKAGPMIHLAPSLLSADFAAIGEQIAIVEARGRRLLHLDSMDGRFVPNITWGPKIVADLRKAHHAAVRLSPDDRRTRKVRRRVPQGRRRHHHVSLRSDGARSIGCCSTCARSARRPGSRSTRGTPVSMLQDLIGTDRSAARS